MKKSIFLSKTLFLVLISFVTIAPIFCMDTPPEEEQTDANKIIVPVPIAAEFTDPSIMFLTTEQLNQSLILPVPTERGLGITSWIRDKAMGEEKNLLLTLQNGTFNPNNISCLHKVATALEIYSKIRPNDEELTQILSILATNHSDTIRLDRLPATYAHTFLTTRNQEKKNALKKQLIQEDQAFLEDINHGLLKLQESFQTQLTDLQKKSEKYFSDRKSTVQEKCTDIRRIKQGLIRIHNLTLNADKILRKDGYCSDDEKNPENVSNSYDNLFILKQIKADEQLNNTNLNTTDLLATLLSIYTSLIRLQKIQYQ